MTQVGWDFTTEVADIDEMILANETPDRYVTRLAAEKANAIAGRRLDSIVLGADTTVVIGDEILGKPIDLEDARRMLRRLSGREHFVLTGVAIAYMGETFTDVSRTAVRFNELSDQEIDFLVEKGEPLDKAGGYAVQAQAALFINEIEGDYWNVVGLPVSMLYQMIQRLGRRQATPLNA